jgi:N5-(carboxyethyl)ornithine synthase
MLGAEVVQYDRKTESMLRDEIGEYDVIVNCILWDVQRTDHIIYESDLARMKKNSMIIDVSCDRNGGIETSIPTTKSGVEQKVGRAIVNLILDKK